MNNNNIHVKILCSYCNISYLDFYIVTRNLKFIMNLCKDIIIDKLFYFLIIFILEKSMHNKKKNLNKFKVILLKKTLFYLMEEDK